MAYELHIEREGDPISLDEWRGAVGAIGGARLENAASAEAVNPQTGERISVKFPEGRVAVRFRPGDPGAGPEPEWVPAIRFSGGRGSFKAVPGVERPDHPVRIVASQIARACGARIHGDNGEAYDW